MWFAPNLASRDMLRLFTHPEEWRQTRRDVGVFQFYAAHLGATDACLECDDNVLVNFMNASAFEKLRRWGVATAVEASAVKEWGCTADATLPLAERVVDHVRAAGGDVRYLAMDEPLLGGQRCQQPMQVTAAETAGFASALRAGFPRLEVGDIEPYPQFAIPQLVEWLDALGERGLVPAFFHIDVDRPRAGLLAKDISGDLTALRNACAARGIPLGVIFWGADGLDETGYATDVLDWVDTVRNVIGRPQQVVFQSWSVSPDGSREVPINLPENDTTTWTHTRLLREGLRRFRNPKQRRRGADRES